MEIMGIKFAPLNIPIKRRLETLIVGITIISVTFGSIFALLFTLLFLCVTGQWLAVSMYLVWIWIIDKNISERGGRRVEWVRGLFIWKYFRNYFPVHLEKDTAEELDPRKNYLFCAFPHGMLATGIFSSIATRAGGFDKLFPNHKPHILTLKQNFKWPIYREFLLAQGFCSVSAKSINWLMQSPNGGNIAVVVVGGAAESFYCRPGHYQLVLKYRKGFVKLALKNGSPLVPVFSFGETDLYDQVSNPEGSLLRRFQEYIKEKTGVAPVIPLGRGFFQYSYGLIPRRKSINVIVGKPIDVKKLENPTKEEIDAVHAEFIENLNNLFEKYKYKYLKDPENTTLIIS